VLVLKHYQWQEIMAWICLMVQAEDVENALFANVQVFQLAENVE
jgi:hypothetical protein